MNPSGPIEFRRLGLEDPHRSSDFDLSPSSRSLIDVVSPPPVTLFSLPPELLSTTFEHVPRHPSRSRFSTLASLCLVNRLFLAIARPILYRELHLDLSPPSTKAGRSFTRLCSTLEESRAISGSVKRLRLTLAKAVYDQMQQLSSTMGRLVNLDELRMDWWSTAASSALAKDLLVILRRHGRRLRVLSLPNFGIDPSRFAILVSALPELHTFVGCVDLSLVSPPSPSISIVLQLRHLVLRTAVAQSPFSNLFRSSHSTLRSLSFAFGPETGALDLSDFGSLATPRLRVDLPSSFKFPEREGVLRLSLDLRQIVTSVARSPIQTFSLSSDSGYAAKLLSEQPLFDLLPSSLVILEITPLFISHCPLALEVNVNLTLLSESIQNRQLPLLATIKLLSPFVLFSPPSCFCAPFGTTRSRKIRELFLRSGIRIEPDGERRTNSNHRGIYIDPNNTDSEPEQEGQD